jgi:serine/threonine protein kinase
MLNACPQCQRTFPAEQSAFCPADGAALKPINEVPLVKDPDDPIVGYTLADRFEIRRVIAEGSMGRVYEARALADERRVAVKILHPQVAEDQVNIERFRREAETSRQIGHAHIVEVIDFASVPGVPGRASRTWYLAMEYLDGEELRELLNREKTLSLATVVRAASQIALALKPAHDAGLVHRDMKPDNVFIIRDGDDLGVKLLDFGSVKFTRGQDRGHKLTVLGTTIGSPYYMAPEQAQGDPDLDHRADVWAVNAILYEALVGRVPFRGSNGPQILFRILSDEPEPPTFVNDRLPSGVDDVIMKGFRKKPSERYQSVGELADALGHALGLKGSYVDWAVMPSAELLKQLPGSKAPPTLDTTTDKVNRPTSGAHAQARVASDEGAASPPSTETTPSYTDPDEFPVAPPSKTPFYVAIIAAALLVIGGVTALLLR